MNVNEERAGNAAGLNRMLRPGVAIAGKLGQGQSVAWLPSQNGAFLECLHPHQATVRAWVISTFFGEYSVPLCDPSQNGWVLDPPQAHHQ